MKPRPALFRAELNSYFVLHQIYFKPDEINPCGICLVPIEPNETVDTELRQTHLNALERATIVKMINTAKTLGGPV